MPPDTLTLQDLFGLMSRLPVTPTIVTMPDLTFPGPTISYVNQAFCEMVGYSVDELVGQSPRVLQGTATERHILAEMGRRLRSGQAARSVITNYRRNGEIYLCAFEIQPVTEPDGRIVAYAAFEAEVVRRRGRPKAGFLGRYDPRDRDVVLPGGLA